MTKSVFLSRHWQCDWDRFMLKNEVVPNHMLSRWYCIVDQNLLVILCLYDFINFKISNTTGRNAAHTICRNDIFSSLDQSLLFYEGWTKNESEKLFIKTTFEI